MNVTFQGNTAVFFGGGIYNVANISGASSPSLMNVSFQENTASDAGGGIYNYADEFSASSPSLVNVTFQGNTATDKGGGIYSFAGTASASRSNLVNVILWGNSAPSGAQVFHEGARAVTTFTNSLVQGGVSGAGLGSANGGTSVDRGNNLDADPLFVNAAGGNLRLQSGSPAIDTGSNVSVTVAVDLDGLPRILDGNGDAIATVDMGAYEAPAYALTLAAAGNGSGQISRNPPGTVCALPCSPAYASGSVVTLTAVATSSSTFVMWDGACSGAGACVVTMDAPKAVTATFNLNSYALTVNTVGSGSVAKLPDQATYLHGTAVTLTATAAVSTTFSGWSGACTGAGACAVTMDAAKSVTATFTVIPAQNGSVQGTVVDEEDDPIAAAEVTLTDAAGVVATADLPPQSTDADGDYQFSGVPAGTYTLTVSAEGYVTSDPVAVTVMAGQTTSVPTVVLQPPAPRLYLPLINRAD